MSLPSGRRAITISTVTSSRPMIRSIQSPPNSPGLLQSSPSSSRNRTVSSRSSTTSPMWTKSMMGREDTSPHGGERKVPDGGESADGAVDVAGAQQHAVLPQPRDDVRPIHDLPVDLRVDA